MIIKGYRIVEYRSRAGRSYYGEWLDTLAPGAQGRIEGRLQRVAEGHLGDYRSVGFGVYEFRFHFGAGYRVYFAFDGDAVIVLLVGGSKSTQRRDIAVAREYRFDYQRRGYDKTRN